MNNILAYARPILSALFPFIVLHYYSLYAYQLSLWDITRWWFSNAGKVENFGAYLLGMFFSFIVLSMSFSGFVNTFYLSLTGKNHELIYLGHHKESQALYYKINDVSKTPLSGYDVDQKYNFSFDPLFRSQIFKLDPLMPDSIGTKSNRFKLAGFISVILSIILFLMVFLPYFNALGHAVYIATGRDTGLNTESAMLAYEQIIARLNFSKGLYYGLIPLLLFSWMASVVAMSKNTMSERLISLPHSISPGNIVQGIPVAMNVRYVERKRFPESSSNQYETVDSGDRYVIFKFTQGFSQPVYVTTIINSTSHPKSINTIKKKLTAHEFVSVLIDESLEMTLVD